MGVVKLVKDFFKNVQICTLVLARNDAMTAQQAENIDLNIELLMADNDQQKKEIRARYIDRINRRNGMPTKTNLESAQEQEASRKGATPTSDDFVTPPEEAYKEVQTKYSNPEKSGNGK